MRSRASWLNLFTVIAILAAAGCTLLPVGNVQPAMPLPSATPAPTSTQATLAPSPTSPPTPTIAVFELRPTFTPMPTNTPLPADLLSASGQWLAKLPPDVNPLTGLQVSDVSLLERRPMVVKITNFPRSVRPQWGLTLADHVYEYYLEDGLTRFIGVFYGQDAEQVGPVRSARPFDEHVVRMYKGIFVFGYADDRVVDPLVESDLKNLLVFERPNNCPPLCRIGPENAYNTLYVNTQQLTEYIRERGVDNVRQELSGLRFEDSPMVALGGWEVERIAIRYSRTSHNYWEYNPETERYQRWQEADSRDIGEEVYLPLVDSLTSQPIEADNLVILLPPIGYYFKSNSTEIYDIALKGQGEGFAMRQGKVFKIEWKRFKPDQLISLVYPGGIPYPLKPGNIWFEVLSSDSVRQVDGATWNFFFNLDLP
ncbi:MAG: DUF3048 domain-containing protein [Anaerolineales bacterium]|nr:DUF3048 domain-containing protein [Anaerolineales bacterium]